MSNDKNNTSNPQPTNKPALEEHLDNVGVGSVDYGQLIKGGRVFDVVNSMPPPPNPDRDDKNQG